MITTKDILRRCQFSPYLKGKGPTFTLTTWYTGKTDSYGKSVIGYQLEMRNYYNMRNGRILKKWYPEKPIVLFEGEDFHCSPLHCIDSDNTIAGLMSFLTLRPGDTDKEYFDNYTAEQLDYCQQYAEALSYLVSDRYPNM